MHSVFLFHAIKEGLDMAIVNAGQITIYSDIPKDLIKIIEDVIFHPSETTNTALTEYAIRCKDELTGTSISAAQQAEWRSLDVESRIIHALVKGVTQHIVDDLKEALETLNMLPLDLIEGPMMKGMDKVGDLFGSGQMFLPQVLKSASVMKKGVAYLRPLMALADEQAIKLAAQNAQNGATSTETEQTTSTSSASSTPSTKHNGTIVLATVKGDVHDIGKNIVGVVLQCNNYNIIDLGTQVPARKIIQAVKDNNAICFGLSGLITPSLRVMVKVADEAKAAGITIPLLIGGATTSPIHTAMKILPKYAPHPCIHVADASKAVVVVSNLLDSNRKAFMQEVTDYYEELCEDYLETHLDPLVSFTESTSLKPKYSWKQFKPHVPKKLGIFPVTVSISDVSSYIDWNMFFATYEIRGTYPTRSFPRIFDDPRVGSVAHDLYQEALATLKSWEKNNSVTLSGIYGIFPALSKEEDIHVYDPKAASVDAKSTPISTFFGLRQQSVYGNAPHLALGDFILPASETSTETTTDYVGAFVCTSGKEVDVMAKAFKESGDMDKMTLSQALGDRLAEAFAEYLHFKVRTDYWGYSPDEHLSTHDVLHIKYQGIRPAPGYPMQPDASERDTLLKLLKADSIGVELTESWAMTPVSTTCGFYLANPESKYFQLGKVDMEQLSAYAKRKGITLEAAKELGIHYND